MHTGLKLNPPAPPSLDWGAPGMLGAIAGLGAIVPLMAGLFGSKGMKLFAGKVSMTKLEKACVAFVVALGERLEEVNKRLERQEEDLRAARSDLSTAEARAARAEADVEDLKAKLAERRTPEARPNAPSKKHNHRQRA